MKLSSKATNLSLLVATVAAFATGIGAFLAGSPSQRLAVSLHAVAGFGVLVLFVWKRRIIARAVARRGAGAWLAPSAALLGVVLAALASGVAWSTTGLPSIDGYSGLTVHAALGAGAVLLLLPHANLHWPRLGRRDLPGRRALLRTAILSGAAVALWQATEFTTRLAGLSGAARRFTGSRLVARFSGNAFPSSSWLTDDPAPLDPAVWRLTVTGHVLRPLRLSLAELPAQRELDAVLDCTGGWYTEQRWSGAPVAALLVQSGVRPGARSVVVRASTGYWRRYTLDEARRALLATSVGGEPLAHEHGAPLRLVVP
ncbi:MAG TPA: molybdopterin-dependent oxidoreductase, partial [Dehalococcoidia bacterium]|nr:molybdopterin-dependent oxidoreductase [Dehalococcoidia bacterium]